MGCEINISNISKKYKDTDTLAVDEINLQIQPGQFFGLLGPNGAGKTTTISMLCSLMKPTSGNVQIKGKDLYDNLNELRKLMGVVPQDIALYDKLTAIENLNFFGRMYGMQKKSLYIAIEEYLRVFGLDVKKDKKLSTYSGGMKRRLNLITGILHKPQILFLDEPTVGIDVQSRTVIMEYLKKLQGDGMTIIYTSHHMEEAEKYCSEIAIIDKGSIIEKGVPTELIKKHTGCNNLEEIFLNITGRSLRD